MPTEPLPAVEIVEPIRRNIVLLAIRMFLVLFIADTIYAGFLLIIVLGYVSADWTPAYSIFLWVAHTIKNIVLAYIILQLVIKWFSTLYYINAGHLIRQRGVITVKETVFQLTDIESVTLNQGWLGRMLDFGDVSITFLIAREQEQVILYAISNPRRYEQLFSKFV